MNELIKITQNELGEQLISARELHNFLEVKSRFNDWMENRIEKYKFIEGYDYTKVLVECVRGQNKYDYILKLDMAKELSMVENNDKGRQARKYFIDCENKLKNISIQSQQQRLYERSPQELLADNALALNKMFEGLGLNIPKELVVSSAIDGTRNAIGYDFPEVRQLLNKQEEEESYHTKSEVCKSLGIKSNRVNSSLVILGLQVEGSTTMQPWILTDLGKEYGVERAYTSNSHQGYEIKWKENLSDFIAKNIDSIPCEWIK